MNLQKAIKLTKALLLIYLGTLIWILIFKLGVRFSYMEERRINLIPFNGKNDLAEMIMNVVIFLPLGIYVGVLSKRWTFIKSVFVFFLISLAFEGIQYIFRIGAFDMTDVVTNTFGGIVGFMLYYLIQKVFKNDVKAHKFINIIAAIGTTLMILLLVLLKMGMLFVRYQ